MVRIRSVLLAVTLSVVLAQVFPEAGLAQTSGASILILEPSVRASGMGRTSTAVFWGGDTDDYANPALLGYHQGVRLTHGKTRLVPDLAEGVYLKTDRVTLGLWGVGISLVGRPIKGFGHARLDYGQSVATREDGLELGTFDSYENLYSFAVGVNLVEFAENAVARRLHSPHPVSRYADVSFGYATKKADVFLAPAWATPDGQDGNSSVKTDDAGVLVRLTPINTMDGAGILALDSELARMAEPLGGVRLDFAYGRSWLNRGRGHIVYVDQDQADPIARIGKHGWAVRGALGLPPFVRDGLKAWRLGFLAEGLAPLIQVGVARDRNHVEWPDWHEPDIRNRGWELTVANVFTYRRGHIEDKRGDIIDDTSGWGLGFQVGRFGGFRYDRALVPQARVLGRVRPAGFTIFVRPLEILAAR